MAGILSQEAQNQRKKIFDELELTNPTALKEICNMYDNKTDLNKIFGIDVSQDNDKAAMTFISTPTGNNNYYERFVPTYTKYGEENIPLKEFQESEKKLFEGIVDKFEESKKTFLPNEELFKKEYLGNFSEFDHPHKEYSPRIVMTESCPSVSEAICASFMKSSKIPKSYILPIKHKVYDLHKHTKSHDKVRGLRPTSIFIDDLFPTQINKKSFPLSHNQLKNIYINAIKDKQFLRRGIFISTLIDKYNFENLLDPNLDELFKYWLEHVYNKKYEPILNKKIVQKTLEEYKVWYTEWLEFGLGTHLNQYRYTKWCNYNHIEPPFPYKHSWSHNVEYNKYISDKFLEEYYEQS